MNEKKISTLRETSVGEHFLIMVGVHAQKIGIATGRRPIRDSRNWVLEVNGEIIEYEHTALRIVPNDYQPITEALA